MSPVTQPSSQGLPQDVSRNKPQRLFFALWPDETLRQRLADHIKSLLNPPFSSLSQDLPREVQGVRGRPVPTDNLHITLAFLGDVDIDQQACIERMATEVVEELACGPFELALDHIGHWSRSRVLWLGSAETPETLVRLADRLADGARECGLSMDTRPYRAHLTLMRKVARAPKQLPVEPLTWPVSGFVLVRSVPVPQGVNYEVLREWPLRASAVD